MMVVKLRWAGARVHLLMEPSRATR